MHKCNNIIEIIIIFPRKISKKFHFANLPENEAESIGGKNRDPITLKKE